MNINQAREYLFQDVITLDELRPVSFLLVGGVIVRAAVEQTELLLKSLSVIEEARPADDEDGDPAVRRLEAKIDILTRLVSNLTTHQGREASNLPRELRWSIRGAEFVSDHYFTEGSTGLVRLKVSDHLPEAIQLPGAVRFVEPDDQGGYRTVVEFTELPPSLTEHLEQHLFRTQRKAIAKLRRSELAAAP